MKTQGNGFKFEEFYRAFGKSVRIPINLDQTEVQNTKENVPSTITPLPPIIHDKHSKPHHVDDFTLNHVSLPTHLAALAALQESDGSWKYTDKFEYVINKVAPPPPNGISGKLWATAIVIIIWRQFPEYYDQLEGAYTKAILHVDDNVLLRVRENLDISLISEIRTLQDNESKLLRERLEREAAAKRAKESDEERRLEIEREKAIQATKYGMSRARQLPKETQRLMVSALGADVERIYPNASKTAIARCQSSVSLEYKVNDIVECCWRRPDRASRPIISTKWSPCKVTALGSDNITMNVKFLDQHQERERNVPVRCVRWSMNDARTLRQSKFESLTHLWVQPISLADEVPRLQEIEARSKYRNPWYEYSQPNHPKSVYQPIATETTKKTLPADITTLSLYSQEEQSTLDHLHQNVIRLLLVHEETLAKLRRVLATAQQLYRKAELFRDRLHSFDAFTGTAVDIVQHTCDIIESIEVWKCKQSSVIRHHSSVQTEPIADSVRLSRPLFFMWNGTFVVATIVRSLDFLADCSELVEWYGEDFPFGMNPFLRSESVRDRVEMSSFAFTSKMKGLTAENSLRVAIKLGQKAKEKRKKESVAAQEETTDTPTWWPEGQYTPALCNRIEHAEDFIIEELLAMGMIRNAS